MTSLPADPLDQGGIAAFALALKHFFGNAHRADGFIKMTFNRYGTCVGL